MTIGGPEWGDAHYMPSLWVRGPVVADGAGGASDAAPQFRHRVLIAGKSVWVNQNCPPFIILDLDPSVPYPIPVVAAVHSVDPRLEGPKAMARAAMTDVSASSWSEGHFLVNPHWFATLESDGAPVVGSGSRTGLHCWPSEGQVQYVLSDESEEAGRDRHGLRGSASLFARPFADERATSLLVAGVGSEHRPTSQGAWVLVVPEKTNAHEAVIMQLGLEGGQPRVVGSWVLGLRYTSTPTLGTLEFTWEAGREGTIGTVELRPGRAPLVLRVELSPGKLVATPSRRGQTPREPVVIDLPQ